MRQLLTLLIFFTFIVNAVFSSDCINTMILLNQDHRASGVGNYEKTMNNPNSSVYHDQATPIRDGQHGGKIVTYKKNQHGWGSIYTKGTDSLNPQGDMRWFISLFGAESAEFFGFKQIDENTLETPDADELNGAIEKLNVWLKKHGQPLISIRFYNQTAAQRKLLSTYINRFNEVNEAPLIPLAVDAHNGAHDRSFHTTAILMPNSMLFHNQRRARYQQRLIQAVENNFTPTHPQSTKKLIRSMKLNLVKQLDGLTGNLGVGIISWAEKDNPTQEALNDILSRLQIDSAMSPADDIILFDFKANWEVALEEDSKGNPSSGENPNNLRRTEVESFITSYFRRNPPPYDLIEPFHIFDSHKKKTIPNPRYPEFQKQLCEQISTGRKMIILGAQELQKIKE